MNKLKLLVLYVILMVWACSNTSDKKENLKDLTFGDLVELEKLDRVIMANNSGSFQLTDEQMAKLKAELSKMIYDPNITVKVGAIAIELSIDGKSHYITSRTHGDYIEVHKSIVTTNNWALGETNWLYFKTGNVNFDNYKNESQ